MDFCLNKIRFYFTLEFLCKEPLIMLSYERALSIPFLKVIHLQINLTKNKWIQLEIFFLNAKTTWSCVGNQFRYLREQKVQPINLYLKYFIFPKKNLFLKIPFQPIKYDLQKKKVLYYKDKLLSFKNFNFYLYDDLSRLIKLRSCFLCFFDWKKSHPLTYLHQEIPYRSYRNT